MRAGDTGGLDLSLSGNSDRWDVSANARHKVGRALDLTATLAAGAQWGDPTDWVGTIGMEMRW